MAVTVATVVGAIITAAGGAYMVGEHFGYSGQLKNDWYQQHKWEIRTGVCLALGPLGGAFIDSQTGPSYFT